MNATETICRFCHRHRLGSLDICGHCHGITTHSPANQAHTGTCDACEAPARYGCYLCPTCESDFIDDLLHRGEQLELPRYHPRPPSEMALQLFQRFKNERGL